MALKTISNVNTVSTLGTKMWNCLCMVILCPYHGEINDILWRCVWHTDTTSIWSAKFTLCVIFCFKTLFSTTKSSSIESQVCLNYIKLSALSKMCPTNWLAT